MKSTSGVCFPSTEPPSITCAAFVAAMNGGLACKVPLAGCRHYSRPQIREGAGPHFNYRKALTSLAFMSYIQFKHVQLYFINKSSGHGLGTPRSPAETLIPVTPSALTSLPSLAALRPIPPSP